MKYLTLDLYERIVEAVHEKSRNHLRMLGHVTKNECDNYLGFYALHGGLFWSEQDGIVRGVATAHPGKRFFDWKWQEDGSVWTTHLVWGDNVLAQQETLGQFLSQRTTPVTELWTCRKNKLILLSIPKLERIFKYGRRKHHNTSTTST